MPSCTSASQWQFSVTTPPILLTAAFLTVHLSESQYALQFTLILFLMLVL